MRQKRKDDLDEAYREGFRLGVAETVAFGLDFKELQARLDKATTALNQAADAAEKAAATINKATARIIEERRMRR